ncbi:MAG: hypothetical protein Q7T05_07340 [Dehalococcoidia bacterium]|nr:hypothetical protein [Dehalococcoidia bacterium]
MGRKSLVCALCGLIIGMALSVSVTQRSASTGAFTASFSTTLRIWGVNASVLGNGYVSISWLTSAAASSQVFYGAEAHADSADYEFRSYTDPIQTLRHEVTLGGLEDSTIPHFRTVSIALVRGVQFTAISGDFTIEMPGAPDPPHDRQVDLGQLTGSTPLVLNAAGVTLASAKLTTGDGRASLTIAAGTRMLDSSGQPLWSLSATVPTGPLPTSIDTIIAAWDFGPQGATFVPPMTLTLAYSAQTLSAGVLGDTMYIAFWDGSVWQKLPSMVDTNAGTVSAPCSHFTLFAIMGNKQAVTPAPTTTPAPTPAPSPTTTNTATTKPATQPSPTTPASTTTQTTPPSQTPDPSAPSSSTSPSPTPSPSTSSKPAGPSNNGPVYLWIVAACLAAAVALSMAVLVARARRKG